MKIKNNNKKTKMANTFDVNWIDESLMPIVNSVFNERFSGCSQPERTIEDRSFAMIIPKPIFKNYLYLSDGVNREVNCVIIKIVEKEDGYFTQVVYRTPDGIWMNTTNPDYSVRVTLDDNFQAFRWVVCDCMKAD